jgi:hypothetical protein
VARRQTLSDTVVVSRMRSGDVAERTGVSPWMIRYHEQHVCPVEGAHPAAIGGSMNETCAVTDSADNAGCGCVCNDRLPVLDTAAQQKLGAGQPCKSDIGSSRHRPSEKLSRDPKLVERLGVCMWQLPRQFGRCRRRRGRTVAGPTRFPADLSAAEMPRTFHDRSFSLEVEPMSSRTRLAHAVSSRCALSASIHAASCPIRHPERPIAGDRVGNGGCGLLWGCLVRLALLERLFLITVQPRVS